MAMANERMDLKRDVPEEDSRRRIETLADARRELAKFIRDPEELEGSAREFMQLGSRLAGFGAGRSEQAQVYEQYLAQIERNGAAERGAANLSWPEQHAIASLTAVDATLEAMRQTLQSSRERQAAAREREEQTILLRGDETRFADNSRHGGFTRPGTTEGAASVLREFMRDPAEANRKAGEIVAAGRALSQHMRGDARTRERMFHDYFGASAKTFAEEGSRMPVENRFTELLVRSISLDLSTNQERFIEGKRDRLEVLLEQLREEVLQTRSSPTAQRAHIEADSYSHASDDLRELFEAPEDRTRAEHADYLNRTNKFARDLYERGAGLYGDVLIIPAEAHSGEHFSDNIRIGSIEHAVDRFSRFRLDRNELAEKAQEFVELGRQIAGRTADGRMRLAVFQTYYKEISHEANEETFSQRDGSGVNIQYNGRRRSPEEQRAQLDLTLETMRNVAAAMREFEWTVERGETLEIGEWEESLSARERAAENETIGHAGIDNQDDREPSREDERGEVGGYSFGDHHESVRLDQMPPRPPLDISDEERQWLRGVMLPQVDRQLEAGARPAGIIRGLSIAERAEERRARDEIINEIFHARSPDADHNHHVTRDEELRALYTLRALALDAQSTEEKRENVSATHQARQTAPYERAVASVNAQIEERRPTLPERAAALDAVQHRATSTLGFEIERLASFEEVEREIAEVDRRRELHQTQVRQSPEWLRALQVVETVRRDAHLDAKEQLIRGNISRFSITSRGVAERGDLTRLAHAPMPSTPDGNHEAPRYPELTGDAPLVSRFVEAQQSGAEAERAARAKLLALVEVPELDRQRAQLEEKRAAHVRHYRAAINSEISAGTEARSSVAPYTNALARIAERAAGERAQIREIPLSPSAPRKGEQELGATNPVFISVSDKTRARLPVGNFNEYQTLVRTAAGKGTDGKDKTQIAVHVFTGLYRAPVSGHSEERAASYIYLRQYITYRQQDEQTRMRNESRLYRDFIGRLDAARSIDELRQTANAIRKENYDREKHPTEYQAESDEARRKGEQAKAPLSENEMKKLFLSLAPERHTDEMRRFRLDKAGTGREREERIKELAAGRAAPSASLDKLLTEFGRVRTWKDVRAFTVQLLNPPESLPERLPRFSRVNLYAEHEHLAPAERDYLFRTISERRDDLKAGTRVRVEERTARAVREQAAEKEPTEPPTTLLREVPRESGSFRAYTTAASWREAELIARFMHERSAHGQVHPANALSDDTHSSVVHGISDRNLQTATTLLKEFKPALIKLVAGEFRGSNDREMRQVGEILTTFQEMKRERMAGGQIEYRITTPDKSDIPHAGWERLLAHLQPQLSDQSSHHALIPDARRRELRREALGQAWTDVAPSELHDLERIVDAPVALLSRALEVREQLARAGKQQAQARYADDLVREVVTAVALKAERALREEKISVASDRELLRELAASALGSTLRQRTGNRTATLHAPTGATKSDSVYRSEELEHARQAVLSSITPRDRTRYGQLAAYALTTRDEYLASFAQIDERTLEFDRTREQSRSSVGGEREQDVSNLPRDLQSIAMQEYEAAKRSFERKGLAEELRRMLDDPQSDTAARVVELSRDETKRARDLVPSERAAAIQVEASREAWWQLMPPELLNRETDREQTLSPPLKSAALHVSRAIRTAQLIERGIHVSHQEQAQLSLTGDADGALTHGFADIDRARESLVKAREVDAAEKRFAMFSRIRGEMERDVGGYLKKVLHQHGESAFAPGKGSAHHTQMTTAIMKEAFARHGIEPETLNLNDSRIEEIAGTIVSSLPREFARTHEENNRLMQHERREQEQETLREEHALTRNMAASARVPAEVEKTYGHRHGDGETLNLEEQFVEQKVANQLNRAQETLSHVIPGPPHTFTREQNQAHQLDPVAEIAKPKEHTRQHVLAR